ncbi:MAG: hypothetical protein HY097_04195 [Nitrospinae bacterium]|nr:hypothetical protein [Nitrospinota bacterium]
MRKLIYLLFIVLILCAASSAYAKEIPFAQEDRDRLRNVELRLERLETKVDEGLKATNQRIDGLEKSVNQRIDDVNKRIDDVRDEIRDLKTFMLWGFGILFGGMGILIGFVIWDRRTTVAPVARALKEKEGEIEELKKREAEIEKRERGIEEILRDYAQKEPRLAELMKAKGF